MTSFVSSTTDHWQGSTCHTGAAARMLKKVNQVGSLVDLIRAVLTWWPPFLMVHLHRDACFYSYMFCLKIMTITKSVFNVKYVIHTKPEGHSFSPHGPPYWIIPTSTKGDNHEDGPKDEDDRNASAEVAQVAQVAHNQPNGTNLRNRRG